MSHGSVDRSVDTRACVFEPQPLPDIFIINVYLVLYQFSLYVFVSVLRTDHWSIIETSKIWKKYTP